MGRCVPVRRERMVAVQNGVQGAPARGSCEAVVISRELFRRASHHACLCRRRFLPSKRIRFFLHHMQVALGDLNIFMPQEFLDFLQLKLS